MTILLSERVKKALSGSDAEMQGPVYESENFPGPKIPKKYIPQFRERDLFGSAGLSAEDVRRFRECFSCEFSYWADDGMRICGKRERPIIERRREVCAWKEAK